MKLWDLDFQRSPEDRVRMLFWRMHRCARVLFSLGYELGELSPEDCVQMLIERVGHEPSSAEAEVRRSVQGGYPPLYQAAYLVGGLQFRALQRELVGHGKLSPRAFHDAILRGNSIPVELVRAELRGELLGAEFRPKWRFCHPREPQGAPYMRDLAHSLIGWCICDWASPRNAVTLACWALR